ncbi:hypothetical protein [Micromonospora maritima]|uniref:hypothetical protein n=1 Tax=Micromonospora maritima TaxID=986711 RepID=UPI00378B8095
MTSGGLRVARVWGDGPFREIGEPRLAEVSPDGRLVVAAGALGHPRWHGHDMSRRAGPGPGWYALGVYRTDDLTCLHQVTTRWPVNAVAFHPTLPLVTVGTGAYDGGWAYEGELLLLHLDSGIVTPLLPHPREVRRVGWRDPRTLELVLAVPCDADAGRFGSTSLAWSVARDDWSPTTGTLRPPFGVEPVPTPPGPEPAAAAAELDRLARLRGRTWTPRRRVCAVRALSAGRVLAALDGVGLECWSADSGTRMWQVPTDGAGHQILVRPGEGVALALTGTPPRRHAGRPVHDAGVLHEVDLGGGEVRSTVRLAGRMVATARADGWWALRDARWDPRTAPGDVVVRAPDGSPAGAARLGHYDPINHFFDIRYAPELLFLRGRADPPWRDKWVVAVDTAGRTRRLFRLEWDTARAGHLYGGFGAYLDDRDGPALVHTGAVHDGAGPLPGHAFVVRRAYDGGAARWVFTADHQATALDVGDGRVYVGLNSGELVVLDAGDGTVRLRQELRVRGHPVVPLSLTRVASGRLVVGTLDGRLLDCRVVG